MTLGEGKFEIFSRVSCSAKDGPGSTIDVIATGSEMLPSNLIVRYDVIDPEMYFNDGEPGQLSNIYSITIVGADDYEIDSLYFDESGKVLRVIGPCKPVEANEAVITNFFETWF